jgi:tetratricopeptide (TPR) repeat protein
VKRYQIVAVLIAVGAIAMAFAVYRNQSARLPQIPINQVDSTALKVIQQHERAVRDAPRSGSAWGELGALLRSYEFHDQALYCLRRAEQLDAREARWPYLIGAMLLDESRTDGIFEMRKAVQKGGQERPELRIQLAKVLAEGGGLEEAQRTLEEGLRILPNHAPTRLMLAHIFQQRGDWQKVEEHARACTQDRQTARAAWKLLSLSYQHAGNSEAAEADRQAALAPSEAKDPEPYEAEVMLARGDPRWLSDHAQEFMRSGQITEAVALIDRLLKTHPEFPETWLLLGRMQLLQKRPVEAEKSFRRHLALDPQSLNGTFQLGRALQEQQKFSEAAAGFAHATELKPDFGPAWFNLGACLAKLGRKAEAREPLRQAIRHNPEHIDSYIFLADLYAQAGEQDAALDLLNEATAVNANDPRIRSLKRRIETGSTQRSAP